MHSTVLINYHCYLTFPHNTHKELHEMFDGKEYVVEFDFLGKDSIRYYNCVPVEKQVFKSLRLFVTDKQPSDDLFDRLTVTTIAVIVLFCVFKAPLMHVDCTKLKLFYGLHDLV